MLTGAQCNGICDCPNANGRESCRKLINFNDENDCFLVGQISLECKDGKCLYADGLYQRLSNVCRRESINNEAFNGNIDSIELNSIGAETNSYCTSVGTQTPSVKDATIQTTNSLESLTEESPSDLNIKFSSFSNRRIRNYINYSKLVNSEFTKTSSIDSSFKDESTQCESCESENKISWGVRQNYHRKTFCQCNDPFYAKEEIGVDEIRFGNGNINTKAQRCSCKIDHFYYPDTRNNFNRRISLGVHSHPNHYLPPYPIYIDKQSPVICPCYNLLRFDTVNENCDFKQNDDEQCTEKFLVNSINNNGIFIDNSQGSTLDCKENFHAQQQHNIEASRVQVENETNVNRAFDNAEYKVEILDEKVKKNRIKSEYLDNDLERDSDLVEENEQSKPLLGDKSYSMDKNDEKVNSSHESIVVRDEIAKEDAEATVECANGCHCHQHDFATNSIRVRPSKKKSSSTSPLKVITLLLIASAFLITGSALKDAYYP